MAKLSSDSLNPCKDLDKNLSDCKSRQSNKTEAKKIPSITSNLGMQNMDQILTTEKQKLLEETKDHHRLLNKNKKKKPKSGRSSSKSNKSSPKNTKILEIESEFDSAHEG